MLRRYLVAASLTPIFAAMIVGWASGQEPRQPPQSTLTSKNLGILGLYRPSPTQLLVLLRFPQVGSELSVTNDQTQGINRIAADLMRPIVPAPGQGNSEDARKQAAADRAKAIETRLATVLQPGQMTRLKQVQIHVLGTAAFLRSDVAANLQLTDDEKASLKQIDGDTLQAVKDLKTLGIGSPAWQEKFYSTRKAGMDKAAAVLTTDQQNAFATLKGAAFHLNVFPQTAAKGATNSSGTTN
jgi:hypothetical protein